MSEQDRYGYGYGDYGRSFYRGRRRPRSPFGDIKLSALGKMYADVPVDAVTKAMEGLNLNYKENTQMLDKYKSALAQAKVMAGDEPEKQKIIKDIQDRVNTFVEDTGGAFETGDDFIRGIANDVVANPWLAQSITNKEKFDEDQKLLDQMRMQGLAPMYLADENFTTMGPEGQNRQYTSYIGSEVNRRTALEPFFKNLKANKAADYNALLDVFTSQGVSQARVDKVVAGALPLLQETKEYRQSLENEKARAANQGIPFNEEAFNKGWLNQLEQVGREFVYNQNDMNLNRSANRFTTGDGDDNTINTTSVEDFGAGMIGGIEQDSWFMGGSSRTNDQFTYYSENTKHDPTFNQLEPTQQRLLGNVIDLTNATGNLFKGQRGEFHNKTNNKTYNARRTGNVYSVPVIVDFNKNGVYGNNSSVIAKAFKDQLGLTWNPDDQEDNAGQLPHSGATGGFALPGRSAGRFDRNFTSFEPRSMQVGNYTINYLMPSEADESPIVVEMLPKMEYEVFDTTGENRQGTVLGDMSPQNAAHFKVNPDIRWTSYKQDQGIVDRSQTNIRLNNTINQINRVPGYEKVVSDLQAIQANVNSTGQLDQESINLLNQIDRTLMPMILRHTNANIAKPKGELSSRKTN